MDFIKNTNSKYIQIRFLAQKNAQKRVQNIQEEETGPRNEECRQCALVECQSALPQCRLE